MEAVKTYITIAVCFIEATVLGGSLFGWPSLVYVYQQDGLYYYLCEDPEGFNTTGNTTLDPLVNYNESTQYAPSIKVPTCLAQKVQMSLAYTLACIGYGSIGFPLGIFFDTFGLRMTRVILVILGFLSYLMLGLATPGSDWLIMTGGLGMGITCYGMVMTTCHVALLSKTSTSTVTGLLMAGIDTSFALTGVKLAYDSGIPKLHSLLFLGCFWFLVLFSTFILLPPFKAGLDKNLNEQDTTKPTQIENITKGTDYKAPVAGGPTPWNSHSEKTISEKIVKRVKILFSPSFIIFNFWFCAQIVRVGMLTNSFDAWMTDIVNRDQYKVSFYTNILAYFNFLEAIPCVMTGYLTDRIISSAGTKPGGKELALLPAVTLSIFISTAYTVSTYYRTEVAIYFTVLFFDLTKPVLLTAAHSYLSLMYPPKIFGLMYGTAYAVIGAGSSVMYAYFLWIERSNSFDPVTTFMLVTLVLSFAQPLRMVYSWWRSQPTQLQDEKIALVPHENGR